MSLYINFEPHSWYKGFAIKDNRFTGLYEDNQKVYADWEAYTDDGNTYRVIKLDADTLTELKNKIREYRKREAERLERLYA